MNNEYFKRIESYLSKNEFKQFIDTFDMEPKYGFLLDKYKLNRSTINIEDLEKNWLLDKTYDCDGYTYYTYDKNRLEKLNIFPGKSIYHHAGLIYIQEPSSNMVLRDINIKEKPRIIDLCSAPGGKSIQAFLQYKNHKRFVCNEIDKKRLNILRSNLERMGFIDKIEIGNFSVDKYLEENDHFDLVILDAPCSGEGIMRKNNIAKEQWSINLIKKMSYIQKSLIDVAVKLLDEGGILSYSTCTYAKEEDEENVDYILDNYKNIQLIDMRKIYHFENIGEGQFYARFKKI